MLAPESISVAILAGGKGTRLAPFTAIFPKPLVPLGEKPVLEILLRRLAQAGFRRIRMCTGHLAELIMAVFGDGRALGLEIAYFREDLPLGTAGPLRLVDDLSDPCLVVNGDLLTTLNFGHMLDHHQKEGAAATIALYPRTVTIEFGVVQRDGAGAFAGYLEKPSYSYQVSMGINLLSRAALDLIPEGRYDLPDLILKVHESGLKVACFSEQCSWLDIGRPEDYALAQETYSRNPHEYLP